MKSRHSPHSIDLKVTTSLFILNKEGQCEDKSQTEMNRNKVKEFSTKLSSMFFEKNTISHQTPTMLATTWTSPGIDIAQVITASLRAVCAIIQSLFSAPYRRFIKNLVNQNAFRNPNTDDEDF